MSRESIQFCGRVTMGGRRGGALAGDRKGQGKMTFSDRAFAAKEIDKLRWRIHLGLAQHDVTETLFWKLPASSTSLSETISLWWRDLIGLDDVLSD